VSRWTCPLQPPRERPPHEHPPGAELLPPFSGRLCPAALPLLPGSGSGGPAAVCIGIALAGPRPAREDKMGMRLMPDSPTATMFAAWSRNVPQRSRSTCGGIPGGNQTELEHPQQPNAPDSGSGRRLGPVNLRSTDSQRRFYSEALPFRCRGSVRASVRIRARSAQGGSRVAANASAAPARFSGRTRDASPRRRAAGFRD